LLDIQVPRLGGACLIPLEREKLLTTGRLHVGP